MRKLVTFLLAISSIFLLISCQKETDPGGTAVEKMAGDWWITVQCSEQGMQAPTTIPSLDQLTNWNWELFGIYLITTYNTAKNVDTEMFIDDAGAYWDFIGKVDVNYAERTFSASDAQNLSYDSKFTILGGKIIEGGATTPTGNKADAIEFYIHFSDDEEFGVMKCTGFRRTGFPDDDL